MTPLLCFGKNEVPVNRHLKATFVAWDQRDGLDGMLVSQRSGKSLNNLGRQTDSPWCEVSSRAKLDFDSHGDDLTRTPPCHI